ncbi:MAG: peptidyl-prolyl cis-trans isomerase [Aeromicrobium sp.]
MSRSRIWLIAALAVVVGMVVAVVVLTRPDVPKDAAFVYGDRVVSKAELNRRIDALRALYGITAPKSAAKRDDFRRDAAKSYAVTLILEHKAKEAGITVSEKKTRDLLDKFIDAQFGNRDSFIEALGNVGTSEHAVLDEVRRQAATLELRKKTVAGVKISNAYLKSSFERRKGELATPQQRRLKNIVVGSQKDALQVAQRLRAGESVDALAAAVSIDESTRTTGGDLGYVAAGQLERPVAQAAFSVHEGEVYGPAKASHGWNVGVVAAIRPSQPADFDAVREPFRKLLLQEQQSLVWSRWLAKAIHEADVHYAKAYAPADPDAPPPLETPKEGNR